MSAQAVDVLAVMECAALKAVWERDEANANGDEARAERWERQRAELRDAQAAVAELIRTGQVLHAAWALGGRDPTDEEIDAHFVALTRVIGGGA